ncbi:MAG: phage/plasmid primase, P4 family [Actinomycetota bacterium]
MTPDRETLELERMAREELAAPEVEGTPRAINATGQAPAEHTTDLGNARRLARRHGDVLRYCGPWRSWLCWDGQLWRRDATGEAERRAKQTSASIFGEAERAAESEARAKLAKWAMQSEAEARLRAMLALAQSEPGIPVLPADLDSDPYLLTCANGTLDLRTGKLLEPDPGHLISRATDVAYEPGAGCPRWQRFLAEVFAGDEELVAFLHRLVGYTLTGDTREHVLAVLHGTGCNGKTTFVETTKALLGDLAVTSAFDSFARVRGNRGPRNDLARLHRSRMVVASESGEGRRLDEATVKQLTGGDTIAARFLYGEHFEFQPDFKLWLVTNHRPRVDGADDAIWRRLRLIPFEVSFEGREERELPATLIEELPGILSWAVEGCLDWQRNGLGAAAAVERATRAYRKDEDVLGAFLADRCALDGEVPVPELRAAYDDYCKTEGERPLAANMLGRQLAARGIRRGGKGDSLYRGVSLR